MAGAGGDGLVGARRRLGLPRVIVSPAGDGAVGCNSAAVVPTDSDGLVGAGRRVGLPEAVLPPADDGLIGCERATVELADGDGLVGVVEPAVARRSAGIRWRLLGRGLSHLNRLGVRGLSRGIEPVDRRR